MNSSAAQPPARGASLLVLAVALAARVAFVCWAGARFPPTADGTYYDTIAHRIAAGQGYTWAWSDGSVTYAAHYPVGYPGLLAFGYWLLGDGAWVPGLLNAMVGSLAALAVHRILLRGSPASVALLGGLLVSLHPGLVAYSPALMTEGVAASLVACCLWLAVRAGEAPSPRRWLALGTVVGLATYVRPELLLLAPMLVLCTPLGGARLRGRFARSLGPLAIVSVSALAVVSPWTLRNHQRMGHASLVSMNDGWNLLIGTNREAKGSWAEVVVPEECRDTFDEAEKNACFRRAALKIICSRPLAWSSLVPAKLAATFSYSGAGPWYLHASNPAAFGEKAKVAWGAVETVFERLAILFGLVSVWRRCREDAPKRTVDLIFAVGVLCSLIPGTGFLAILALVILLAIAVCRPHRPVPPVFSLALVQLCALCLVSAVFFGAGRYALVSFPIVSALGATAWRRPAPSF